MRHALAWGYLGAAAILFAASNAHSADTASTAEATPQAGKVIRLFDGKTLDGWIQDPLAPTIISGGDITDFTAFVKKVSDKSDPVSALVSEQLDDATQSSLASYSPADAAATKTLKSAIAKGVNKLISGPSIYDEIRFKSVQLRLESEQLREKNPEGKNLARVNRMLLEDAYPKELAASPPASWIVKDGAMASTGAGRGVIYTKDDYTKYRLMFTMRQVTGNHQPCFLIFCTRPAEGEKALDALGGIQFQVPNGGHWDYRPGQNKGGVGFTNPTKPKFDNKQWSRIEILVDATKGTARMAVANPADGKAIEVLDYDVPEAGKTGPIAWQMHNGGIFDEYKDVTIEIDPPVNDLLTVK
jgi:hypothetical protein